MIIGIHIYQVKTQCRMQEWLLTLAALLKYLPPSNILYSGTLVHLITLTLRDILMIFGIHLYHVNMV